MMTGVDVAIRFGPPDNSSLIARKILETRIVTCAAPAYLKKHGEPRTPHDLIHHELLLFRDPLTGRAFPWEFHRRGKIIEIWAGRRCALWFAAIYDSVILRNGADCQEIGTTPDVP